MVNQDFGVEYKGNSVNYADDFINSIGDGFVLTNREAGKEGKDSGKYGAVVIIPGNFSKNITTINDVTPAKVEIYYELNKNLSKEDRLIIEGKIANLEKNLSFFFQAIIASLFICFSFYYAIHDICDLLPSSLLIVIPNFLFLFHTYQSF